MKFKFLLLTLILSFQALIAQNTVVDIIVNSPDHNVLETAVIEAGLAGTLSGPGPFTVFAPTDAAFSAIPDSVINALLADPTGTLTDILTYHVIGDSLTTDGLEEAILTTLNGATSILSNLDNDIYIDNAEVTIRDIAASNGVVHVIDVVLDPTRETIADVVINSPDHNTLEALLTSVSGLGALSASESYTLFAPTDLAFENLGQATIDAVLADEELLLSILSRHVVEGAVLSSMLSDGMQVETADGEIVIVEINSDNEIFINGAQVTVANIERDNGVVHVVDAVIMSTPNTVADIIANSAVHNILEIAIDSAGLTDALSNIDAELTVFAPTDDAFNALPAGTIETLLADPSGLLTTILTNHVIGATVPAALVSNGLQAEALGGEMLNFTVTENGEVFVENAQVIITDLDADNGVVHVINVVLDPNRTTVYDLVAGSMDHNILELAIDTANLNGALSLDGPYTVFAPTDDAFNALPDGTIGALLDDPSGILTTVLLNHVVGGNIPASLVANGVQVESLAGETLNFTITDAGEVFIENVQVTVTDLDADNGVVHVINGVLDPNRSTVYDVIAGSMDHNVLELAIDTATLNGVLSLDGPYTVFAPTDDAFNALPDGTIGALLDDPSGILTTVLLNHVVGGNIPASLVANGVQVESVAGETLNFTVTDAGEVFIENVQVTVTDLDADNGVVHVINGVLDPNRVTVYDIVEGSMDHNVLEIAIDTATLNGVLSLDGPYTVFAPTDDAFNALPDGTIAALLDDPSGILTTILLNHVIGDNIPASMVANGVQLETVSGEKLNFTVTDAGEVFIENVQVIVTDLDADNGVVHVIDGVLDPTRLTINEVVENSDVHQTLETAITLAKLNGTLSTDGPFTVFAPTDDAFINFDQGTLAALIADPEGDLAKVLLYHVVSGKILSGDLSSGSVTTVLGQTIDVVVDGSSVTVNGNSVIQADIETDNGVVHVLDGVLVPDLVNLNELPYDVVSVFPSPAIDYIQVEMTKEIDDARINIINQQGQIVRQAAFSRNERINVGDLNKGFYILAITSDSGNFISKFTKI